MDENKNEVEVAPVEEVATEEAVVEETVAAPETASSEVTPEGDPSVLNVGG